ncbi:MULTISPECIES: hypothetical protein [Enterococcus]|uniref:Uncharacterized protein n=1 Tax=Enterococcus mundtii TaxID=53346 RepID=A0A1V2UCH5_ENTMU|nr:hypothetical protein [Enterococcus mundtii]ONN40981.1 hypothetical protein BTN92_14115 [Enterococcus mundtii]
MKLNELLKFCPDKADVTFEIVEETYPTGILVKDIIATFPRAAEYEVTLLDAGVSTHDGKDIPTLCIEVSNLN